MTIMVKGLVELRVLRRAIDIGFSVLEMAEIVN